MGVGRVGDGGVGMVAGEGGRLGVELGCGGGSGASGEREREREREQAKR